MSDPSTEPLFETLRFKLSTAVVSDVLDTMGYTRQYLPPTIKPIDPKTKLVGRAMPAQVADSVMYDNAIGPLGNQLFGLMVAALDGLRENEVFIATGASQPYAIWGGLLSTRAKAAKAAGAIIDGYARDSADIEQLGFPVFAQGLYGRALGVRGKIIDYRCPIEIGNVRVEPGDLVFGDREGVVVIPKGIEHDAVEQALVKANVEAKIAAAMHNGKTARESFEEFL